MMAKRKIAFSPSTMDKKKKEKYRKKTGNLIKV
jgi:hypothetical protein